MKKNFTLKREQLSFQIIILLILTSTAKDLSNLDKKKLNELNK